MTGDRARRRLPASSVALALVALALPGVAPARAPVTVPSTANNEQGARASTERLFQTERAPRIERARPSRSHPRAQIHRARTTARPRTRARAIERSPRTARSARDARPTSAQTPRADASATLVQTIDLSLMSPPSSDASDVAYDPINDRLIVVDGEIDEPNMAWLYQGVNMFSMTRQGVYVSGGSTTVPNPHDFSKEPVGASFIPESNTLLIVDDNQDDLSFVKAGPDGVFGNANDSVVEKVHVIRAFMGSNADPEGVTYDTSTGEIWITDGLNAEVWRWHPGPNGTFDDTPAGATDTSMIDDVFTHFDTEVHGLVDSEGIAYDQFSDTLLCLSVNGNLLYRYQKDGTLVETISVSGAGAFSPSGVTLAPASFDPGAISIWMTDRGIDNGPQGTEPTSQNDGKLFELTLGTFSNFQPSVTIQSPADGANVPANTPVTFKATATDVEDGDVTPSIVWESSALVGSPNCSASTPTQSICTLTLKPGQQTVRAKAVDSIGVFGLKQIGLYVGPGPYTLTVPVAAGSDDAEERPTGGSVRLGDSHLQMVQDGSNVQTVGLRFAGIRVPAGAYLAGATVQFTTHTASSGTISLTIESQAADNAATFTATNGSVSARPRNGASVTWVPPAWTTAGQAGSAQRTPDLSPVVEPVLGRAGWAAGNALALIITGSGFRTAHSADSGAVSAPRLTITFQFAPPVTITSPADGASLPIGRPSTFGAAAGSLTSTISWSSDRDGPLGTGGTISAALSGNADGSARTHVITASVTDARGNTGTASITVQTQNLAPVVQITAPGNNSTHPATSPITFTGTAVDPDDGNLVYRLVWRSNVSGSIGRGGQARRQLAPGVHIITAEATDRFGLKGLAQITIQVGAAAPAVRASEPAPAVLEHIPPVADPAPAPPSPDPAAAAQAEPVEEQTAQT